jgi:DNA polymerase I
MQAPTRGALAPAKKRVYLVDGSGYIFRAFHALPPMTRADGTPVNAVFGFTNMLLKLVEDSEAEHVAVIFDTARTSFRNEIYPEYKAHRPDPPPELVPQFALIREATRACGLAAVEMSGFEADDLIATYARLALESGHEVVVVSSDKDLMQLVRPGVALLDPIKNRGIGEAEVREKFGVGPDKVVDVQALAGDSSDNVPGVPGIGVKTAAELIGRYGDLDALLARAAEIKQPKRRQSLLDHAELARISRTLVRLRDDVPIEHSLDDFTIGAPDWDKLLDFLRHQGFKSILARIEARRAEAGRKDGARATSAAARPSPAAEPTAGVHTAPWGQYALVQDEAALQDWVERATEAGIVAVDTETTSLDAVQAELVGVSLGLAPGEACYIPLGHSAQAKGELELGPAAAPLQIGRERALAILKPLLADPGVLKIGQNIKYDMVVLARYAVAVEPIDDTMLLSYVLEGSGQGHGMDALSERHLGHKTISYAEVTGKGKAQIGFAQVPLEAARDYAAEDADVTFRLHALLKPRLVAEHMVQVYESMERPLAAVLAGMERAGIKLDRARLVELSGDFGRRMADLEFEIHKLAGHEFNVGSPKQLGEVLFDELRLGGGRRMKTGAYSTDADVLEELADSHPLPQRVLDWRQIAKLKSTYADALAEAINPQTGRVHTSYAMAATSTGRLASTDPNLQNIPIRTEEGRKIRGAFVAEAGHVLLAADYSQIELRLLAHVAGIDALKEAFRRGVDIHALTASQVFGVPTKGMDAAVRRKAKAINFGIIYGISPFGLARQLGIPQSEAKDYIEAYFRRYPGIRAYMETARAEARAKGFVVTLFGRKCAIPGIQDKNPARRGFAERQAINAPLQGAAADIIKRAMVRMPEALGHAKLKARMLLQVHDELLFEVPEREAEATAALVKATMEAAADLSVPLVVETGAATTWAGAH